MKAIVATQFGPAEVLTLQEVEKPAPKDNELLIRVLATTVNAGDIRMRSFTVPPMFWLPARLTLGFTKPKNPIYGMELAGVVEAVGKDVKRFKPGDAVFAPTMAHKFGAHAEYKCLPEDAAIAGKPQNLSFEEAATLAIGANTALYYLKAAGLRPGQKALIYGASGNVGTFAVQLARHFGAEVTGVTSTRNLDLVKSLGAERVIDYTQTDFTRGGQTYDVVFDTVGKTTFSQVSPILKSGGSYLNAVLVTGGLLHAWYSRTAGKNVISGTAPHSIQASQTLKELAEAGAMKPVIDRCYPLEQLAEAHRYVETGRKTGNVVITVTA